MKGLIYREECRGHVAKRRCEREKGIRRWEIRVHSWAALWCEAWPHLCSIPLMFNLLFFHHLCFLEFQFNALLWKGILFCQIIMSLSIFTTIQYIFSSTGTCINIYNFLSLSLPSSFSCILFCYFVWNEWWLTCNFVIFV